MLYARGIKTHAVWICECICTYEKKNAKNTREGEEKTYEVVDYDIWCGFPNNITFVTISKNIFILLGNICI